MAGVGEEIALTGEGDSPESVAHAGNSATGAALILASSRLKTLRLCSVYREWQRYAGDIHNVPPMGGRDISVPESSRTLWLSSLLFLPVRSTASHHTLVGQVELRYGGHFVRRARDRCATLEGAAGEGAPIPLGSGARRRYLSCIGIVTARPSLPSRPGLSRAPGLTLTG
jgi:hypothetical protein